MPRGTLKRRANQKRLLADLTIFAELEREEFSDVQVITLNQYVREFALAQTLTELDDIMFMGKPEAINERVNFLVETKYTSAKEFVFIEEDIIRIGVNRSEVDDAAIDHALSLLIQVENFNPGERFEFGDKVKINAGGNSQI